MDTRREFLKKAAMLGAGAGLASLPESIARALSINPAVGSTFMDAEHVVILMQENRSFDHCYGTLQGVRGFNDPRAITLPNKNPVWFQSNAAGETYAPFRLNIRDTNATWMGSLPHSWTDQVDALNKGKMDQWLIAKRPGNKAYHHMPLTLGYYTREDIPFYYAFADAFIVCDQHFCSSLTGTTPNRLYLWTGTVRETPSTAAYANVRNENLDYDKLAKWTTYPERLETSGVSWRIYQNELSVGAGFEGEEDAWLGNFTNNPLEWFEQYHVKYHRAYRDALPEQIRKLSAERTVLSSRADAGTLDEAGRKKLEALTLALAKMERDAAHYTQQGFDALAGQQQAVHRRAFTTNTNDPRYHELTTIRYNDQGTGREVRVPAGDTLSRFREDVTNNRLPAVSWLIAPENFSDHPGAPWYGAWYVSEALDILTQNPDVWKKTIFILTYDENDGYFDHVPPFTPVNPLRRHGGRMSAGIDPHVEFVTLEQDKVKKAEAYCRESPIGLGYRVPMVIASPWSRGGHVCSQVFDHTSVLQFLELFLRNKTGKTINEPNISAWRRTVCGDLTSVFRPYNGEQVKFPVRLDRDEFIEGVHSAQYKGYPQGYRRLSADAAAAKSDDVMPRQEKGIRSACALPYELYADGVLSADKRSFSVTFEAARAAFGATAAGSPFNVYAPGNYSDDGTLASCHNWQYAVAAGDRLSDQWPLANFEQQQYFLRVYGPNGFFREFTGDAQDPAIIVACGYEWKGKKLTGNLSIAVTNKHDRDVTISLRDNAYGASPIERNVKAGATAKLVIELAKSHRWYDITLRAATHERFAQRFCGRVETGAAGFTDPAMGAVLS